MIDAFLAKKIIISKGYCNLFVLISVGNSADGIWTRYDHGYLLRQYTVWSFSIKCTNMYSQSPDGQVFTTESNLVGTLNIFLS